MDHEVAIPVGIVIAREQIDHPWQEYRWRPVSVFLDAPETLKWRELRRGPGFVHFHAATLPLILHRKETAGYSVNLANGVPSVYVVLHESAESNDAEPVHVHLVTASPFEAQAQAESGFDIVERVAMPDRIVELVEAFIDEHHVDERFVKRRRENREKEEPHFFGQEPIYVVRERMKPATAKNRRND